MANVFISHRKCDDQPAEELADEVKTAGHAVWFDEWTVNLGDSIVQRMDEGLAGADFLILCLSDQGVHSAWMSREWMATLARQLNGHGVRVLPVVLTGGGPPAILSDIQYADLVRDRARGIARLLRTLES